MEVLHRESEYDSADGKSHIHYHIWQPQGEVKAVVQLTHGMAEHMARYDGFARLLAENGMAVAGQDHPGHGGSAQKENYGFFDEKDPNGVVIRDMRTLTKIMKERFPDQPYFLFGHSMGSFFAREYACLYGEDLQGAIFCGTGGQAVALANIGKFVCKTIARFQGWHYRSKFVDNLANGGNNKRIANQRTPFDWLSANAENVDAYMADERCGFLFTVNGYYGLFDAISKVMSPKYVRAMPKALPVLFVAGQEDPVGAYGKGVERSAALCRKAGLTDVTVQLFPTYRHEILNENDPAVGQYILDWIVEKL